MLENIIEKHSGWIASILVTLFLTWYFSSYLPKQQFREINQQKAEIQGIWLIQTNTRYSTVEQFKNMRLFYIVSLSTDNNLNTTGIAYKTKEINNQEEILYKRKYWAKATINGGLTNNMILLNWQITDYQGQESIMTTKGRFIDQAIRGNFYNEVGSQTGNFCAKKIYIENINTMPIQKISDMCNPVFSPIENL